MTGSSPDTDEREAVLAAARRAKDAAVDLATASRAAKDAALIAMADALVKHSDVIVKANAIDVARAEENGTAEGIVDRLTLTPDRIAAIADALRDVADLADPVGVVIRGWTQPNGLQIRQVRVPLGVLGIIYEARPNVTVDAAGLGLKSGNAVLLRGSSSAYDSNTALVSVMQDALEASGLPRDAVQLVPGTSHESVKHLITARGLVDVLIPRGGAALIRSVVEDSTVPSIETGIGNCHVYVDKDADVDKAVRILVNSKAQRPSVCNAAETFLVHQDIADAFLPQALTALKDAGVTVHGDDRIAAYVDASGVGSPPSPTRTGRSSTTPTTSRPVSSTPSTKRLRHIRKWGSGHTEAIVTDSVGAAQRFVAGVDAAAVMVNASTRFTDGGEFGFGAEIGISTQKLHARGPMGLPELTSTTYVVTGDGQVRG